MKTLKKPRRRKGGEELAEHFHFFSRALSTEGEPFESGKEERRVMKEGEKTTQGPIRGYEETKKKQGLENYS